MKGKLLENIVLTIGLLVIGAAVFLMFFAQSPEIAKSVNLIFATGFVIYIMYNYIMARNLNGEIYELEKHVKNLKEEVGRLEGAIAAKDKTITAQKGTISSQESQLAEASKKIEETQEELNKSKESLKASQAEAKALKTRLSKEEKS